MRGLVHGTGLIIREQGIRALFNGLLPTTVRQASSSAVRFGSYMTMKQMAQSYIPPGEKLSSAATFGIGAMAGTITVYVTMPIDVVKSRMQSLHASQYNNSLECAYKIATEEGIRALWSGALPRLARLMMSGGIVFTLYNIFPLSYILEML
ncbi:Mitoferrin [Arthrobotrys entomopaga]|nr:Mitoferrin [Arthrobotrys entomopaga]